MIGYWDSALRNRFANQAYVAWLGKQPGANLGRHISELLDEQTFKANLPFMEATLQGQAQQFERTINTPNGVRHSLVNYLPDYRDGRVEGFCRGSRCHRDHRKPLSARQGAGENGQHHCWYAYRHLGMGH